MKTLIIFLLYIILTNAWADDSRIGNGGDGVLDSNTGKIALLDFIESSDLTNKEYFHPGVSFGPIGLNTTEGMPYAPKVLEAKHYLGDLFSLKFYNACKGKSTLYGDAYVLMSLEVDHGLNPTKPLIWIFTNKKLSEIDDEGAVRYLDSNKSKSQIAIQKDGIVIIHKPSYIKMDAINRAGLIMHELLIAMILHKNKDYFMERSTENLREFNKILFTWAFSEKYIPTQVLINACHKI